jgi:hypothetical protein
MLRKFIALSVVATMVVANTVTAFADEGVTGQGVVEYDDSTAISYDKIQVPTLTADTFAFTMDPTGVIGTYADNADFETGKYLFFHSEDDAAYIEAAANGIWYKEDHAVYAADSTSTKYRGIVSAATLNDDDTKVVSVTTVASGFYLWVPDAAFAGGSGSSGKYLEITKDNVEKFFDLSVYTDTDSSKKVELAFRKDYKAGEDICNGVVYQKGYTATGGGAADAKAKFTDSNADPLSDIVTVDNNGEITAIKGLYKAGETAGTYVAATKTDFVYTAATSKYQDHTDDVYVKNLSTKAKTVTAKVTLKDATGLTISNTDSFSAADQKKAAIYVGAWDAGGNSGAGEYKPLAESSGVVSTTVTVSLAAATTTETTYQTNEITKLGGHKYSRFENPGSTYASNVFKIKAAITPTGSDTDAIAAWKKYFEDAEKAPSLNIVYTVANADGSASASAANVVLEMRGSNNYFMVTPNGGTAFDGLTDISGVTAATAKLNNGSAVDVLSLARFSNGAVGFKYVDLKTPLGFDSVTTGDTFVFNITVNGTNYTATYVRP